MNHNGMAAILGLVTVLASSLPAFANEDPGQDLYNRAKRQIETIDRDAQALRDLALKELNGKEYFHRSTTPGGPFLKHTPELIDGWFKDALQALKQMLAALEADHAEVLKPGTKMTLDEFYAKIYGRVADALDLQWALERRVAGAGGWGEPGGRNGMFWAINLRAYDDRLKKWEEGRAKLDRKDKEYDAKLAALNQMLVKEETRTWESLAAPFREMAIRLRDARRRIAGDVWLWQDIAFRRSVVQDDVHDRAQNAFLKQVYDRFGWSRAGNGIMDRLKDNTWLGFHQVVEFFNLDSEQRFQDIRPGDNPWSFTIRGLLDESVESLRRTDAGIPAITATGAPLEQYVKMMHARLKMQRSLDQRVEQLERDMAQRSDRLDDREALRDKLAAWRIALDNYLRLAIPARDEAAQWNDAETELQRHEAQVELKTAALDKVRTELAALEKDLRVLASGNVVRSSDAGAKSASTFAEAEKRLMGKIENLRQNPSAPKENLDRLEGELAELRKKRDAVLAPARQRVQEAEKALADAKAARDRAAEALRKIRKPEDRSARLKELHAAVAAARAEAVRSEKLRAALADLGPVPAELPAFAADAAVGSIIKACTDTRQSVADAEAALKNKIDQLTEELRRNLSDYLALGRYQSQLAIEVLHLRREGVVVARNEIERVTTDPTRDPVIEELDKLLKKLDKVINAFDKAGKLIPERVDFLTEPGDAKWVGLDELLRKLTDKIGLAGRVMKKVKKIGETVLTIEELHRRVKNDDPQALATMLRIIGEVAEAYAEEIPVVGELLATCIKTYASTVDETIGKIKDLQKKIINDTLKVHFHDEQKLAPEQKLYTVGDLKEIVGARLQIGPAAETELKRDAILFQSRRLMYLTGAGPHTQIGNQP